MAIEIVKRNLQERWQLEMGPQRLKDTKLTAGMRVMRLYVQQGSLRVCTTCTVPERHAQNILAGINLYSPTVGMLVAGHIKFQKMWLNAYKRRYNNGFYGAWTSVDINLRLHWIMESSVTAYHFFKDESAALFDEGSMSINSAIWVEGRITKHTIFHGLLPLVVLQTQPASVLLASILRGTPQQFLAWQYTGKDPKGWQFPWGTRPLVRKAITQTTWRLCDAPDL